MKRYLVYLVTLLLFSAVLYVTVLDYGLPNPQYSPSTVQNHWLNGATVFHPDAFAYVGIGYQMLIKGTFNPHYYDNPSLNIYTDMFFFWVSDALALPHNNAYGTREVAPFSLYAMGQFISALFSLLTVALSYAISQKMFNRPVGFLTALIVALSPLSVQHAHYATPNAETITMATAALLFAVIILKQRKPQTLVYIASGFFVGLTMAARYNAVVVVVVIILVYAAAWWQHRRLIPIILGLAAMPTGFVIGTPGSVFAFREWITDVQGILNWYKIQGGGPGWTTNNGIFYHWRYAVLFDVGPVVAILAVIGAVLLLLNWRKSWRPAWFTLALLLYLLIYTLAALPGKRINANLILPLILPLAILAAYAGYWLWERIRLPNGLKTGLGILLIGGWPAYLSLYFVYMISRPDNRILAQAWIEQNVPKGSSVYMLGSYNVPVDPMDYHTGNTYGGYAAPDDPTWKADVVVYSDSFSYVTLRDTALTDNPADVKNIVGTNEKLAQSYVELARFSRMYWPAENFPPDDVSYWHQMEIVIYCKPTSCPVTLPAAKH